MDRAQSSSCCCFISRRLLFMDPTKAIVNWCGWQDVCCSHSCWAWRLQGTLALGSESLLRHDSGNQHLERSSMGGKCAKETAAGWDRDGDTHSVAIFRAARVPDPCVHFCIRRDARVFI